MYIYRLFAYKFNTLYIINIGSPNPGGWFLEATHMGYGVLHPNAVIKTPFGITWVNQNGLYVYEGGSGITELVGEKFLNGYKDAKLRLLLVVTLIFNLFGFPLISLVPVYGKNNLS